MSGGSFTALAYGLYGDKLFADYEQRFLKRDVQGELTNLIATIGSSYLMTPRYPLNMLGA